MSKPTVVLVHGAWHGSWCWDDVAGSLIERGFRVVAVDLPGHESPGSSNRLWSRVSTYVSHVQEVLDGIGGDVVLVGHSMGGLVVQRVLETRNVAGAVLVASVPAKGALPTVLRLARRSPKQLLEATGSLSLWPLISTPTRIREHFFTSGTDPATVEQTRSKLQNESYLAFLSMMARLPRPSKVNTPVLVVAGGGDGIFTLAEQQALAEAHEATLEVIDCGHDVMLEAEWPVLVEIITRWAASPELQRLE